jgi:hypothetical protein
MNNKIVVFLIVLFTIFSLGINAQNEILLLGIIINHIQKSTGKYIGSPSICILPNGDYVSSHDEFGPKSTEFRLPITHIFTSTNKIWKE